MTDDEQSMCGCLILVAIGILVLIGWRAENIWQFLVISGAVIFGVLLIIWGLFGLGQKGLLAKLWGILVGYAGVVLIIAAGRFLFTGDYVTSTTIISQYSGVTITAGMSVSEAESADLTSPEPVATPIPAPEPIPEAVAIPAEWGWLTAAEFSQARVTAALNEIWSGSEQEAAAITMLLEAVSQSTDGEGEYAAGLLTAVAWERAADLEKAYYAYQSVMNLAPETPYAASAAFRQRFLPLPPPDETLSFSERVSNWSQRRSRPDPNDKTKVYEFVLREPKSEGWFLTPGGWGWSTTHAIVQEPLLELRRTDLSFMFFQYVRDRSPFPTEYAYLFVFLVLAMGIKGLALPLYVRSTRLTVKGRRLQPQVSQIQRLYDFDKSLAERKVQELYASHKINPADGCAIAAVDLIFFLWAINAIIAFAPQLATDNASFFWIPDVTRRDLYILVIWAVTAVVSYQVTMKAAQGGRVDSSGLIMFFVFYVAFLWLLNLPAALFIFASLLTIIGILFNGLLHSIWAMIEH
jgi:membrane protein insertase Oxa1/YidC/SpoIIIJ